MSDDSLIPTQVTQQQVGFAPELAPYATKLLGQAYGLTNIQANPYQQYMGERFAQFSPLQQQAFTGAQGMQAAPQLADASALAGTVGTAALGYSGYQPGMFQNFYQGPGQYTPTAFTAPGMGGPSFADTGVQQSYMSPYMQGVVDVQQQQAQRQADIANQALKAQFARSGAFGGGRFGVQQQMAAADLMRQKQGIQAQGLQSAFQQAQQQFNQEQAQRMAAQQAAEQSRQFGFGQQMAGAGLGAQYGQAAAQLGEQSRQYGAGLGLQGLQTALQGAQQLGALGGAQFGQQAAINQLQAQYGQQQQQKMQDILNAQYQDFLNYQNYPYKQLGFMSDILRGVPLTQTGASVYAQPPSTLGTLAGLGLGAYSLMGKKDGGSVSSYASGGLADAHEQVNMAYGGSVMDDDFVRDVLAKLSPAQLEVAYKNAMNSRDGERAKMIAEEIQRRRSEEASFSRGLAAAAPANMEDMMPTEESMRRGGIVAFADRGLVEDEMVPADPGSSGGATSYEGLEALGKEVEALRAQVRNAPGSRQLATNPELRAQYEAARAALPQKEKEYQEYALRHDPMLGRAALADVKSPAVGKRLQPEIAPSLRVPATSSAAAPELPASLRGQNKYEEEAPKKDIEKVSKVVSSAVAKETGQKQEDLETVFDRMFNRLNADNEKLFKEVRDQISLIAKRPEEIRKESTRKALAEFGFAMAAAASQPGVGGGLKGLFRSAGAAAPTITASMAESEKAAQAAENVAAKMKLEQSRYELAMRKGDQQTAMQHAMNIRQLQMQERSLAQQAAAQSESSALRREALAQQGEQFKQTLGIRGLQAAAQLGQASARTAAVRRQAMMDFDNSPQARQLMKTLKEQYPAQKVDYFYNQKRNDYVSNVLAGMPAASPGGGGGTKAPSVFDLLED